MDSTRTNDGQATRGCKRDTGGAYRRLAALLASVFALSTALAGCSSSSGGSGGTSTSPAAGGASPPSASSTTTGATNAAPITLTEEDYYAETSPQGKAIAALVASYEKAFPNVTIKRAILPGTTLESKVINQATTNSLPDIVMADNPMMPDLIATGKFLPLDDDLASWGLSKSYISGAIDAVKGKDGKHYGVFIGTNTLAIVYNKDMFKEAGITSAPTTWDEFYADAKKVTKPKVSGFLFGADCAAWQFNPWQWSAQGNDADLADAGNVKALAFWQKLMNDGLSSKEVISDCQDQTTTEFTTGRTAMMENGPWEFSVLNQSKINWGVFPIPTPAAGDKLIVPLGGEVWTLPNTGSSANETAAAAFIKWTQQADVLGPFDQACGYVPVMASLWPAAEKADPQISAFVKSLAYARSRTTVVGTGYGTWSTALQTAVQQVLANGKSPESALQSAQESYKNGTS